MLWRHWWNLAVQLRGACARRRTFLWMIAFMAGITIRTDLLGVTSIVRALGLLPACYDRILDFMHSPALCLDTLTRLWRGLLLKQSGILRVGGRPVLVGDGIKVAKSGKKMPAVKRLHQQSDSNTKPEYIFGHSCQAVAVLMQAASTIFAVPLTCRIHEGVVFSNRDQRTLLDKMILLVNSLGLEEPFIFVADAYYATAKIVRGLLAKGNHLVTRVKSNAVAYDRPLQPNVNRPRKRGRPGKYGNKVRLAALLANEAAFMDAPSPIYGERNVTLRYHMADLMWRPLGLLVRFVIVRHPTRGSSFLMATDLMLSPLEIIEIYGLRFKIELSFKQALRVLGTFAYHFWMAAMTAIGRKSGDQHLHMKTAEYREEVLRKLAAYHRHIQLGLIAQGLLQILSAAVPTLLWRSFGSWIRTIRPGLAPSEQVVAIALRNSFPDFLTDDENATILTKFLRERIDLTRTEGIRMIL
ncbi:MAG: transposase [Chloroflexota bacterium]